MAKKSKSKTKIKKSRKSRKARNGGRQESATPSEVIGLISDRALKALLASDSGYKEQIDGLTGELREEIKYAVEKQHLDKWVYPVLKKFYRIDSSELLANRWATLLAYMDKSGLMKRIESVPGLPLDGENAGEEAEADEPEGQQEPAAATGQAPGGTVHMLQDRARAN